MIQNRFYTIFDSKAAGYLPPFLARTDQDAIRMVVRAAQEEGGNFQLFGADYTLHCFAQWDEDTGELLPFPSKVNLGTVLQLVSQFAPPPQPQMVADMLDLSNTHKEFDRE